MTIQQKKIKKILKDRKWTQSQLANELGVSEATINRWINGHHKPLTVFCVMIDDLLK